jgi:hypothetical protein
VSSRSFASFVGALSIAALLAACGTSADAPAIRGPETAPTGGAPTSNPTSPGSGRGDARPPQTAQGAERLPSCPAGPLFDHLPLAMDDFRALRPLGFTSVPIHIMPARFSSFSRSLPGEDRPPAPVYFPGDAWVTSILTTEFPANGATGFQLTFSPCRETKFGFNHIGSLSEKLQKAVDEGQRTNCREFDSGQGSIARTCQINLLLAVKSGEPVGRSDEFAGVDFVAIDYRVPPAAFANPAHYGGDFFYYVTPVDYFVPELKKQLESRLRSFDGATARTAPPIAGVYMQDLPGTAQGNWFLPGASPAATSSSDGHLALVHDYIGADEPLLVVGTGIKGLRAGQYSFRPRASGSTNLDFSAIKADARVYCFEGWKGGTTLGGLPLAVAPGSVILTMPAADRLRIEYRPNAASCDLPGQFTDAASIYER